MQKAKRRFILAHHRSPGDLVCLTALMRDIHKAYPGEFETDYNTTVTPVWANNPYITRLWNHDAKSPQILVPNTQMITCQYGKGIREQNHETIHFCAYFHRDFQKQTGIKVPVSLPHGDLHLSAFEKTTPPVTGRYWLVLTGGKSDFTIKVWHSNYFQEVANQLGAMGLGVVQTGANHTGHWHPRLKGDHIIDLCGWGGFREFVQQVYHADGIICGVTAAMHLAAALHKPCVVVAGGRESWWWEAYTASNRGFGTDCPPHPMPHRFLHTIGLLPCCATAGCWRNKVAPLGSDKLLCHRPIITPEMPIAECMQMIKPEHIMAAVKSYYEDKSLPPITPIEPIVLPVQPTPPQAIQASATVVLPVGSPIRINPRANIIPQAPKTPIIRPGQTNFIDDSIVDHPAVGGRVTAFILFYGDHHDLHRKCLTSLLATVPGQRLDLRVGSNAVEPRTIAMIDEYVAQGQITKHYLHDTNDFKYPVMREMFWDLSHPIETKWVLWFDDDSICDVEPNWFNILSTHIAQNHQGKNAHMIGANFIWTTNKRQREIMASRPWYKHRHWRGQDGKPSPNGQKIMFVAGGFWALTVEALRAADIPDLGTGLTHTGGDWQIGEQIYQAGYGIKQFNGQKQFVRTSSVPRRGVTKPTIDQVTRMGTMPVVMASVAPPSPPPLPPPQPKLRRIVEL